MKIKEKYVANMLFVVSKEALIIIFSTTNGMVDRLCFIKMTLLNENQTNDFYIRAI